MSAEKPTEEQPPEDETQAKATSEKKPAAKKAPPKKAVAEKSVDVAESSAVAEPTAKKTDTKKPAADEKPAADKAPVAGKEPVAEVDEEKKAPVAKAEKPTSAKSERPAVAKAEKPKTAVRRESQTADSASRRKVVRAQARYVRTSARKARMVCGHLRGKSVGEARAILAFTPREVARDWSKLLESAVANAENNHELVEEDLFVREAYADEGPTIKRFRPRAQGRATPIRKRTSHLTITLTPKP